jgi:acetyl esterase/lipase
LETFMTTLRKLVLGLSAIAVALGAIAACSPLTALNVLTPDGTYDRITASFGSHPRHKLDVYTPQKRDGAAAVVVFFYGGTWNSGDRGKYAFFGEALASRGIVTVIADYRLFPEVRYPAFLEDGAQAVAWTVSNIGQYGGDPKQLFVMGHSSGAYNAAMIALDPRWLKMVGLTPDIFQGWMGLAGPYDFLPIKNPDVKPVFFHPDTPPESQPINHAGAEAPPTLLMAARGDDLVNPVRNTGGLAQRLRNAGVPVTEVYYDDLSHTSLIGAFSRPLRGLAPALDEVVRFVERYAATAAARDSIHPVPAVPKTVIAERGTAFQ